MSNSQKKQNLTKKEEKKEKLSNSREHLAFIESWRDIEYCTKPREIEPGYFCEKCGHFNPSSTLQCGVCGLALLPNL